MSDAVEASVEGESGGCVIRLWVREPKLAGKQAKVTIVLEAKVKHRRPVHRTAALAKHELALIAGVNTIAVGEVLRGAYLYRGEQLDLTPQAQIVIDDGIVFDTKLALGLEAACRLPPRAEVPDKHRAVHSPRDEFSVVANLRALPPKTRTQVLLLGGLGLPLFMTILIVGVHDTFAETTWFYDHINPVMNTIALGGILGFLLYFGLRSLLRRYMQFQARFPLPRLTRDARCPAAEMIEGQAGLPLRGATVRVVAYNREHGEYFSDKNTGNTKRTVKKDFTRDGRGVVLYERALGDVPANTPLSQFLDGEVVFAELFDALYPPLMLGDSHGMSVRLEAQLLHPQLIDQEAAIDVSDIEVEEFFQYTRHGPPEPSTSSRDRR